MNKRFSAFFFAVALAVAPQTSSAQSEEISAALERMDAIIAQMQTLRSEFASLAASVDVSSTPAPAVQGVTTSAVLGSDLQYGSTNDDIARVQRLLATDGEIYPYGVDSGFFGPKTQEAVRRFQSRFGLDTVGVIGPSTRAILEAFMAAYPDENYPEDVLSKAVPTATSQTTTTASTPTPTETPAPATTGGLRSLTVDEDDGEYIVRSFKSDGTRNRDVIVTADTLEELIELIAERLNVAERTVEGLIDPDDVDFDDDDRSSRDDDDDYSERDAEKAIEEADEVIDEVRDEIRDADEDGKDIDEADELYDEARDEYKKAKEALKDEDYEDAVKNAEDAIELAEEAEDAIGKSGSSDDIDKIEVEVEDGEAEVTVEYENGDEEDFKVEEDDEDDIIEEIADELNIDEDEVEDLVEFDYGRPEYILVQRDDGDTRVRIEFRSGFEDQVVISEDDEDEIIEAIADMFNVDEDDVERVIDFDL